ncbi:hypothetical protein FOZ62_004526 [Perkinsus olseni]|uniref:Uncharacterized protein n=1 Tax=Perkinsus olseni TaxID=32597 RepID=A0A7J6RIE2_PEROL|nr:hypothetical protein FOZ62_004526 [Perkinsus olseni]
MTPDCPNSTANDVDYSLAEGLCNRDLNREVLNTWATRGVQLGRAAALETHLGVTVVTSPRRVTVIYDKVDSHDSAVARVEQAVKAKDSGHLRSLQLLHYTAGSTSSTHGTPPGFPVRAPKEPWV